MNTKGESKKVMDKIRQMSCIACSKSGPSDPDHITTRGAGGKDATNNVWPLCRIHHDERHKKGIGHMIKNYRAMYDFLIDHNREDILDRLERVK